MLRVATLATRDDISNGSFGVRRSSSSGCALNQPAPHQVSLYLPVKYLCFYRGARIRDSSPRSSQLSTLSSSATLYTVNTVGWISLTKTCRKFAIRKEAAGPPFLSTSKGKEEEETSSLPPLEQRNQECSTVTRRKYRRFKGVSQFLSFRDRYTRHWRVWRIVLLRQVIRL